MRPLTQEEAAEIASQGVDPSHFAFDETTGEAVAIGAPQQEQAQPTDDYSMLGESLKAVGRGLSKPVSGLLEFVGKGGQAIDEALGLPRLGSGPSLIGAAGEGINKASNDLLPTNQRFAQEHDILNPVMEGVGQFGGMLIPGAGAARVLGSPMMKTIAEVAPALGAGMEGADALQRAQALGDSQGTAITKAIGSAAGAAATESLLGAGRMVRNLAGPASGSVKEFVKARVKDMFAGGSEEAIQRAIQDGIVAGKLDYDAIIKEGGIGAIVQGLIGGAGGAAQSLAAPKVAEANAATDGGEFSSLAGPDQGDTDLTATPWKAKKLTDAEVDDIVQRDEWNPVIENEFDKAVKEAKKRKILTHGLVQTLEESDKPLADLDAFVRSPGATKEAMAQRSATRVVTPLSADDIVALRNIKADTKLAASTPLLKGMQKLRAAELVFSDDDIQELNRAQDDKESDKIVQAVQLRALRSQTPMSAAEAAQAIQEKHWEKFGKKYKDDTKRIDTAEKAVEDMRKQLEKVVIDPKEHWRLTGQLQKMESDLNTARTKLMQDYLIEYPGPSMLPVHVPRQPMQGPAIPAGAPGLVDPSQSVDPFTARNRTLQLPMQAGDTSVDTAPSGVTDPNWIPGRGDARQAMSGYAADAGLTQTPEQRLFDLQSQHGLIEGYRMWEGEQGLPFGKPGTVVEPPVPEGSVAIGEQLRLTTDPSSTKAVTLITVGAKLPDNLPAGLESVETPHGIAAFNPKKINREEVVEAGNRETFDATKLGMSAADSPPSGTIVTTSTPTAKDVVGEVVTPGNEQAAIAAQQAAVPGGTTEVKPAGEVLTGRKVETQVDEESDPKSWGEEQADNGGAARQFSFGKGVPILKMLYKGVGSIRSDMASRNPVAAYVAAKLQPLFTRMNHYRGKAFNEIATLRKVLEDKRMIAFIRASQASKTWDVSKLPAELQADAARLRRFLKSAHVIQNNRGIAVWRRNAQGVLVPTKAKDDPSYFPDSLNKEVYKARRLGGEKWREFKRDYFNHWKKFNQTTPGWQANAEAALNDLFPSLGSPTMKGGQPEYRPIYIEQGIGLPDSWKNENVAASLETYFDRWSKAIAWAEVVQMNPVLRRAFGITEDPSGKDTSATDPKTFRSVPKAFAEAMREGKRSEGEWTATPATWIDQPIETVFGKDDLGSILASYQGMPSAAAEHSNSVNDTASGLMQIAGSLIMQTPAAVRDVGQALGDIWTYIPAKDWAVAGREMMDVILAPRLALARARSAGAVQVDQYAHEAAGMVSSWAYTAAKGIRGLTLKNAADSYAKTFVFNAVNGVVKHYAQLGKVHELAAEFGPADTAGLTPTQIAEATAAAVVDRVQPSYDARNMGFKMLPQNRHFLGTAFALSRFPIAKYGKWYEDVWVPAKQGKPQRLIKSLLVGSVAAAATQEFISWLTKREPQDLTIREWLSLDEDKKTETLAPMAFGYLQAQGTMGILGNLAYNAAKVYEGKGSAESLIKLSYPPAIVLQDWLEKVGSFGRAAFAGYIGFEDVADLGLELMKSAQNVKVFEAWAGSKPDYRDRRIHEELYGLSARSGNFKAEDSGPKSYTQDPFSLAKRVKAAGDDADELRKVMPAVIERALDGSPIRLQSEVMSPLYYVELSQRRGIAEARRQYEADMKREEEQKAAKVLLKNVGSLAPPRLKWK